MSKPHKPAWFRDGQVFVSFAETVGINKDGNTLFAVDPTSGARLSKVDDAVALDIDALLDGELTQTSTWVENENYKYGAPAYYDKEQYSRRLQELVAKPDLHRFKLCSIGDLISEGKLVARAGHGSPSADLRDGDVPYIKVSDIRAGQVNINPTNMVSRSVAERFWRGSDSGINPYDLVTPIRASKNIGEFALIMPGQQELVFTKEVLILRPGRDSHVDSFFLMWALSLITVREQWKRVIFMQTNREDVGKRYLEIEIPWPVDTTSAARISKPFKEYYEGMEALRRHFVRSISAGGIHHVFLGEPADD